MEIIVMETELEVNGVQRWISWKVMLILYMSLLIVVVVVDVMELMEVPVLIVIKEAIVSVIDGDMVEDSEETMLHPQDSVNPMDLDNTLILIKSLLILLILDQMENYQLL